MEDSKRRWNVTYTRHVKQKRKTYHDGFLDVYIATKKALLFDDLEKLLECGILKDEVVGTGQSLELSAYLIDVGDPETHHNPTAERNTKSSGQKKISEPPRLLLRQKFKSPVHLGAEKHQSWSNRSPSPELVNEWQVLYTTQVTQKAKKYHDGFLRVHLGSHNRQAKLYDTSKRLLTGRFLKKDETITPGECVSLEGHLVEVGEPSGSDFESHDSMIEEKSKVLRKEPDSCLKDAGCDSSALLRRSRPPSNNFRVENKPLRDAAQILSILQKPVAQKSDGSTHLPHVVARLDEALFDKDKENADDPKRGRDASTSEFTEGPSPSVDHAETCQEKDELPTFDLCI